MNDTQEEVKPEILKEKTYIITIISFDRKHDEMMHIMDVFEPFKRLGEINQVEATTEIPLKFLLPMMKTSLEQQGQRVSAIFVANIEDGAWRDETVRVISDGSKWGMLEELLKHLQYKGK